MRFATGCSAALVVLFGVTTAGKGEPRQDQVQQRTQQGQASYYGSEFNGRRMANGERFNPNSDSAAHRTLPLGTTARVTNTENGRTAEVVVRDRGPFVRGRIIDVSPSTADNLDMKQDGVVGAQVTPLAVPDRDQRPGQRPGSQR